MTKKKRQGRDHSHAIAHQGEPAELAARLAPPEEAARAVAHQTHNNGGAIVVDTGDLKLPKDFTEKDDERRGLFGLEPIGVLILAFALAFIGLIAYLISTEPPKANDDPRATAGTTR